jgi:hypothetical protein
MKTVVNGLAEGDPSAIAALVSRAASDPGEPFEADMVDAMATLYRDRRADFERLRARLKEEAPRVRVMEIDKLVEAAARAHADTAAATGNEALTADGLKQRIAQRAAVEGWYAIAYAILEAGRTSRDR